MKLAVAVSAATLLMLVWGCRKTEVSAGDNARVNQEFSQNSYEDAMRAAGKQQELEEEKAKWAAHEAAGTTGSQQGQ